VGLGGQVKNYYSVLGVTEDVDSAELKRAYRNLMRKWHPDVNRKQDATRRTEEVNHAFTVLSCPDSRYKHDVKLRDAGLSSKPLFLKTSYPCLGCNCRGLIKIYSSSRKYKLLKWLGFSVPYEEKTCLDCCGTGTEYKIMEY